MTELKVVKSAEHSKPLENGLLQPSQHQGDLVAFWATRCTWPWHGP